MYLFIVDALCTYLVLGIGLNLQPIVDYDEPTSESENMYHHRFRCQSMADTRIADNFIITIKRNVITNLRRSCRRLN